MSQNHIDYKIIQALRETQDEPKEILDSLMRLLVASYLLAAVTPNVEELIENVSFCYHHYKKIADQENI